MSDTTTITPFERTATGDVQVNIDLIAIGAARLLDAYLEQVHDPDRTVHHQLRRAVSDDPFEELTLSDDSVEHLVAPVRVAQATLAADELDDEAFLAWLAVLGNARSVFAELAAVDPDAHLLHAQLAEVLYRTLVWTLYPDDEQARGA